MKSEQIKITIIIPVYNVEKYLAECLESVCKHSGQDIQIICIDDCSKDNSLDILYKWKQKYSNIEVICNEENKGLSVARNIGMAHAKGEYLMFVDSDDYIAGDMLYVLYDKAKESDADILKFSGKVFVDKENNEICDNNFMIEKEAYECQSGISVMSKMIQNKTGIGSVCSSIFRTQYIRENHMKFIQGISFEDYPFIFKALLEADRVCGIRDVVYYYRRRQNSITHQQNYNRMLESFFVGYMDLITTWYQYNLTHRVGEWEKINVEQYINEILSRLREQYLLAYLGENKEINRAIDFVVCGFSEKDYKKKLMKIRTDKKVAVYGAGTRGWKLISLLRQIGKPIEKIYVTNKENNPDMIQGIEVCEYKKEDVGKDTIVIVAVKRNKEIIQLLEQDEIEFLSV